MVDITADLAKEVEVRAGDIIMELLFEDNGIVDHVLRSDGSAYGDVELRTPEERIMRFLWLRNTGLLTNLTVLPGPGGLGGHARRFVDQFERDVDRVRFDA